MKVRQWPALWLTGLVTLLTLFASEGQAQEPTAPEDQLFVHHRNDPCEAFSAHGFVGRERAVMKAIAQWLSNRTVAATVGEDVVED